MIELRWLVTKHEENSRPDCFPAYKREWKTKVLQQRTRSESRFIGANNSMTTETVWSEWTDIPTVFED